MARRGKGPRSVAPGDDEQQQQQQQQEQQEQQAEDGGDAVGGDGYSTEAHSSPPESRPLSESNSNSNSSSCCTHPHMREPFLAGRSNSLSKSASSNDNHKQRQQQQQPQQQEMVALGPHSGVGCCGGARLVPLHQHQQRQDELRDSHVAIAMAGGLGGTVTAAAAAAAEAAEGAFPEDVEAIRRQRVVNAAAARARRKLILASGVCLVFMAIEVVAGIAANSLALMTDASHLLSDLCAFLIR